jgi:hypothetical protein
MTNFKQLESELLVKSKLEEYKTLLELNLIAMQERYLRGVADVSFLINANKELISAKVEYVRSSSRLISNQIKHLHFQGKLNDIQ